MTQHRKWLFGPEKTAFAKRDVVERVALSGRSYKHEFEPSEIERKLAPIFEHGADVFNLKHGREIIDPRTIWGEISERYSGAVKDATPTASPSRNRAPMRMCSFGA